MKAIILMSFDPSPNARAVPLASPTLAEDLNSGNYMRPRCEASLQSATSFGGGYCAGLFDGLRSTAYVIPDESLRSCAPADATRRQTVEVVVACGIRVALTNGSLV